MVEEEVDEKLTVADGERVLAADEGEAAPELDEKFLDVGDKAGLQFALQEGFGEGEEVEEVGILQQALGDAGVNRGQSGGEVRDGGPLALVGAGFDLEGKRVTGPTLLQSLAGIPRACGEVFDFLDENDVVPPAQQGEGVQIGGYGRWLLLACLGHGLCPFFQSGEAFG